MIIAAFAIAAVAFAAGTLINDREWRRKLKWYSSMDLMLFASKNEFYKITDMSYLTMEWIKENPLKPKDKENLPIK